MRIIKVAEDYGIDWLLAFVGLVDTYLSVYYTYQWHLYTGDPWFEGLIFSFVIVIFSVVIFEFAVRQTITLKEDGRRHWSSPVLFLLWLVVVSYSMQTTVAGTYLGTMKDQVAVLESQAEARTSGLKAELLQDELKQIDAEIESYEKRKTQLEGILQGVDSVEKMFEWKKTTGTVQAQWEEINSLLKEARAKRAYTSEALRQASLAAKVEDLKGSGTDVFAFYARVLGIKDTSKVQFVLAVFKGVILDLINVICFMLVMLREKWRKEAIDVQVREAKDLDSNPRKRKAKALEAFADLCFGPGRARNGLVPGRGRAEAGGISPVDYARITERALLRGVFVKRKGKLYRSKQADRALFLEETRDLALKD